MEDFTFKFFFRMDEHRKKTSISVFAEMRLSATEMCWMAGTFQWQFSQLSLPIQSPFNHQSVILLLRNKNFNYLSLNYAEKIARQYLSTLTLIFAVLTLLSYFEVIKKFKMFQGLAARLSSVLIARPKYTSTVIHFGH